jgi:terminase small subunit-like protein
MFDDAAIKPRGRGRPSGYSDEIATEICARLADGQSLKDICADPEMPCRQAVHEWIASNRHGFGDMYMRAREQQTEGFVDEIISIADSVAGCTDAAVVNAARLRIDARKWIASKLKPRVYGDKLNIQEDGNITVRVVHGLGSAPEAEITPLPAPAIKLIEG